MPAGGHGKRADQETVVGASEQLLERNREIAILREQVMRVSAGRGSLVLIEGPAGIGKTRLLDAALLIAEAAGLTSHRARGSELERGIPHSITRQLFEARLAHAGETEREEVLRGAAASASTVFFGPDLGGVTRGESPFAVLHGLYWMVVNLAERTPLALAVDDAHWADAASLRALAYMANRLADLPILIVLAMRPFEPDAELALLDEIASHPLACPVKPAALSERAVGEFLTQTLGEEVDPAFARACHDATSGNPFFLKEISSAIVAEGVSPTAAEAVRAFNLAPPTVARSVQRRLERLPSSALALARAVAILADSPRPDVAADVSGLEPDEAADSAAALSRAEILQPESLEFAHPIVRSAVYSGMSPLARGKLHRDAARALANARAPDTEIAAQLLAARSGGDAWCVEFLREAARSAMARGAPDLATSYLERALSEPPSADDKPSILLELGTAAVAARGPDGVPFLREALASTHDPSVRTRISLQLAGSLFSQGYFPDAAEVLEDALGHLAQGDQALVALLEGQLNVIALTDLSVLVRFGGLSSLLEQVADKGERANPVQVAVHAWIVSAATGPAGDGAALAEQVLDGLALTDDPLAFVTAATALMGAGRHVEARQAWDGAIAHARRDGSLARLGLAATLRAPVSFRLGSVTLAEADAREVFDRASEANRLGTEVQMPLSWVLAPLVDALLERGEVEEAAHTVERCEIGHDLPELLQFNYLLDSLGRLRMAEGRASEGIAHLRECGRRLDAWGIENPGFVPWRSTLGYALAGLGEREEALELARAEHEAARHFGVAREQGLALRAMARARGGEREIELLRESVHVLESSTAALDLARAQLDFGAALRRRGLRSEARDPLRHALDLAQRCGSRVVAERAHSELLASGARPRKMRLSGVESLTAGERRVADLAAEGLTNRQIAEALYLTQKTVEGHLGNTFRKLDISSRTQLADRLATGP